ncbi:amidohydrolase family protein [Azospirillum sp. TSO22-1]|uniref:metal-dependent hydrolase family protein n=1 Tax=Azospirillum sp. TSO22-1 TaxID=716789 RepID=UPI000D6100F6|nr:amidohydrolase family protein [Azospirillum sp. TSO22-1]PWC41922.1 peptidase M38 [Azospirillum sp. TSO22-1]
MTDDILLANATVLDAAAGALLPDHHVLVRAGRIVEVLDGRLPGSAARTIDLRGAVLMPGLCDGHVHVTAATPDFAALERWSPTYVAARAGDILRGMLLRGFTTVRDAGGCDFGIAQAVEEGYLEGPRILFCGHALSQTGGHADMRARGQNSFEGCFCCSGLGRICDGVDAVRRACRDEIRKGATQIKLMVSGGVASPTDRITNTQFSLDEITAAVEEAEAAGIYVMAHAYTPRAITRAVRCGVRSIEHGNLIDAETVALMKERGTFLVPTLATYDALAREGLQAGLPADIHGKVFEVLDAGQRALELAHHGGVPLVYGSDLLGSMHQHQLREFAIRGEVQAAADVIRSATVDAARLFGMEGEIGVVTPGARADLIVVDGNPLDDLGVLQRPESALKLVMKDGRIFKNLF